MTGMAHCALTQVQHETMVLVSAQLMCEFLSGQIETDGWFGLAIALNHRLGMHTIVTHSTTDHITHTPHHTTVPLCTV